MDILLAIITLIATSIVVLFMGVHIFELLDKRRRRQQRESDRVFARRYCRREVEMYHIGERLRQEMSTEKTKKKPIRKVYGAFSHMADLWKYEG